MKKIIAILLILSLIIVFASCGDDTDTNTDTNTESAVDTNTDTNKDTNTNTDTSTDTGNTDVDDGKTKVVLTSTKSEITVGEKITIKIKVANAQNVKSAGFMVNFDSDIFTFVSGEFLVNGEVVEFKDGTGVIAFNAPTDLNKDVATFTLKATSNATFEEIGVKASL
ncbi:MAG: hypothetical protein IKA02_02440, partial [Clostridia bacterium]|nr:hypothetical protein [Clostridia bacterium]